jgi:phospholipase C
MLENRSFDCMLGMLHPAGEGFDGLTGTERNVLRRENGTEQEFPVWTDPTVGPAGLRVPDPGSGRDRVALCSGGQRHPAPGIYAV